MTSPSSVIISDTSCLILLGKINQLSLLPQLFGRCLLTPTVAAEYGGPLPTWAEILAPTEPQPASLVPFRLDAGEHSALALALEIPRCLVALDDGAGRRAASQLGVVFTGTVGLLLQAKAAGFIPLVRPLLTELRSNGMWLTDAVAERVCRGETGE